MNQMCPWCVVCDPVGGQDSGAAGRNRSCSPGTERGSAADHRPQTAAGLSPRLTDFTTGESVREKRVKIFGFVSTARTRFRRTGSCYRIKKSS